LRKVRPVFSGLGYDNRAGFECGIIDHLQRPYCGEVYHVNRVYGAVTGSILDAARLLLGGRPVVLRSSLFLGSWGGSEASVSKHLEHVFRIAAERYQYDRCTRIYPWDAEIIKTIYGEDKVARGDGWLHARDLFEPLYLESLDYSVSVELYPGSIVARFVFSECRDLDRCVQVASRVWFTPRCFDEMLSYVASALMEDVGGEPVFSNLVGVYLPDPRHGFTIIAFPDYRHPVG